MQFLAGQGAVLVTIDAPVLIEQFTQVWLVRCLIEKLGFCCACPGNDGLQLGNVPGPLACD
jgi:hypothetical protein